MAPTFFIKRSVPQSLLLSPDNLHGETYNTYLAIGPTESNDGARHICGQGRLQDGYFEAVLVLYRLLFG